MKLKWINLPSLAHPFPSLLLMYRPFLLALVIPPLTLIQPHLVMTSTHPLFHLLEDKVHSINLVSTDNSHSRVNKSFHYGFSRWTLCSSVSRMLTSIYLLIIIYWNGKVCVWEFPYFKLFEHFHSLNFVLDLQFNS